MINQPVAPAPTLDDILRLFSETDRKFQETDRLFKAQSAETDRKFQETDRLFKAQSAEADRRSKEVNLKIKELGRQNGGLGEKFGSFTEGLALPSMERILQQRFNMEVVSPSVRVCKAGEHVYVDVLAYANSSINQAYVVEVKSHPKEESIKQLTNLLHRFRTFFPEHKDKTVYGILAGVDWTAPMKSRALAAGFHVATIHDNVFELQSPEGFTPKAW